MAGSDKDFLKRALAADAVSRRQFLKWAGVTGTAVGLSGVLASCGTDDTTTTAGGARPPEGPPPRPGARPPAARSRSAM